MSALSSGCGHPAAPIVVGSTTSTGQTILAEIVAQHLERRLERKIERRLSVGNTLLAFQSLQSGEISLYPENASAIVTEILREPAAADGALVFERARGEMRRIAQAELFPPLGVNDVAVGVIRSADPRAAQISTLSQAAGASPPWRLGVSYDFQQRPDGSPALTGYHLPMAAPVRGLEGGQLYQAFETKQVDMIITTATDGALASPEWKTLADDRNLFAPRQVCLLVRQSALMAEPRLAAVLGELSGKISTEKLRDLNAQVDVQHRRVADVAREFLAGMK